MIHLVILQKLAEMQLQLRRPITPKDLIGEFKIPRTTLWRYLNDLCDARCISKVSRGKYIIQGGALLSDMMDCHRDYDSIVWQVHFYNLGEN